MSDYEGSGDYKTLVRQWDNTTLLQKERSKRRRKTGDVVGTGLTALAATRVPGLWAGVGAGVKGYLDNNTKHKTILKEIERRGLKPHKGDMSDTVAPIFAGAGSAVVGRALGGTAGQGMAGQAGNVIHGITNRAFSGGSGSSNKEKKEKKGKKVASANGVCADCEQSKQSAGAMVPYGQGQSQGLVTPSAYVVPPNQPPPAEIVYRYVPPCAQYPQGCYAPVMTSPVTQQAPVQPVYQQPQQQYIAAPPSPSYATPPSPSYGQPPALMYHYTPAEPQYYQPPPQGGLTRANSMYAPPAAYQPVQRSYTAPYM